MTLKVEKPTGFLHTTPKRKARSARLLVDLPDDLAGQSAGIGLVGLKWTSMDEETNWVFDFVAARFSKAVFLSL